MEYNDHGNAARASAVRSECERFGLIFTIWFTRGFTNADVRKGVLDSQAAGVLVEGEIPASRPEAVDWPDLIEQLGDLNIAKGVVTNFAPFVRDDGTPWPEKAKPLIDDGWACLTECYLSEAPNSTPENTDFYATRNLGWPETQPVLGVYGGKTLDDYPTRDRYRNWSAYNAGAALP